MKIFSAVFFLIIFMSGSASATTIWKIKPYSYVCTSQQLAERVDGHQAVIDWAVNAGQCAETGSKEITFIPLDAGSGWSTAMYGQLNDIHGNPFRAWLSVERIDVGYK